MCIRDSSGADQILMPPDLVGDPAMAKVGSWRVMAQRLSGERGKQFGQVLAELTQVAPGAPAHVQPDAARDFAAVGRGLNIQAVAQHAQHGQIVALLGLLVESLDSAPDAPANGCLLYTSRCV